jgi:hypothetical protein
MRAPSETDDLARWLSDARAMVDLGVVETPDPAGYRVPVERLPGGRWVGYYLQPMAALGAVWMDIELLATPLGDHGVVTLKGRGADLVGRFALSGTADPGGGDVVMTKQYDGAHAITYDGVLDEAGVVRGVWSIPSHGMEGLFALAPEARVATALRDAVALRAHRGPAVHFVLTAVGLFAIPFRFAAILRHHRLVSRWRALRARNHAAE